MSKEYLTPIYRYVYGENFDRNSFESRVKMQKAIYLIQEAGIYIDDYGFFWYKHGPYSQKLQNEINSLDTSSYNINFSKAAMGVFDSIKGSLLDSKVYNVEEWMECMASMWYLFKNILPLNSPEDTVIEELEKRKPHLNCREANQSAWESVKKLMLIEV